MISDFRYFGENFTMKDKTTAILLNLFLGFLGVHCFYLGKGGKGILYLFTGGLFMIGAIIDLFILILMDQTEFNHKYNAQQIRYQNQQRAAMSRPKESELDQVKKLGELRDSGVITEEEFQEKKKRLLDL